MVKKAKKWYTIKDGKGVQNKILTSWTECEKLVKGYSAIYKSFKSEEEVKQGRCIYEVRKYV